MNHILVALAVVSSAVSVAPALAADPVAPDANVAPATPAANTAAVAPRAGQVIRDASGRRLGPIESIRGSDAVVIMDMHMYHIPVSTLSQGEKGLQTSLLRSDLR